MHCIAFLGKAVGTLSLHVEGGRERGREGGREYVKMVIPSITGNVFRERDG